MSKLSVKAQAQTGTTQLPRSGLVQHSLCYVKRSERGSLSKRFSTGLFWYRALRYQAEILSLHPSVERVRVESSKNQRATS